VTKRRPHQDRSDAGRNVLTSADDITGKHKVVARDTGTPITNINPDLFLVPDDDLPAATCSVQLQQTSAGPTASR
jgi:hypothetical protein